ncbi:MAG: type II 3-dehydroquinate dehydratase [Chloroflexi bacterium]|nr:type II 3-dehydroquinate dehydratase [Chloroflexota bacterium]
MKIFVINGPNLNLLGEREPEIYGNQTLPEIENIITEHAKKLNNVQIEFYQSNHEGEIIDALHSHRECDGIIINAGALTHSSTAISDALQSIDLPAIEVHLSNTNARSEEWRHHSYLSPVCWGVIMGFGHLSYTAALDLLYERLSR